MDNQQTTDCTQSRDTLYFDDRLLAERFSAEVVAAGNSADYFVDTDAHQFDDRFCHGVAYTGAEVTAHSATPYSQLGRKASRFTSERD